MLSSILSHKECAECGFCCSFRRCSLWETPVLEPELLDRLRKDYPEAKFRKIRYAVRGKARVDAYTVDLDDLYKTDNPDEEVLCWFNHGEGCMLGDNEPFDCKTWPLRVMNRDGKLIITFTPTCKALSAKPLSEIKKLVDSGLGRRMFEYAKRYPGFVRDYYGHEEYPVLAVLDDDKEI